MDEREDLLSPCDVAHSNAPQDPCGAAYDPNTGLYHLMYEYHPNHVAWGNISWGHGVSRDLITWTDVTGWQNNQSEAFGTSAGGQGVYDGLSIFSGTMQPVNLQGENDGTLLAFYTGDRYLPTNWHSTYIKGTESQAFALSHDGGETWEKYEGNPVITDAPGDWNITGFRDPFFFQWSELNSLLGNTEPHWYMVIGSGVKGDDGGPRIPLYQAPANDLTNWTFLGALWEPAPNSSVGTFLETGSVGYNFEVSNFFGLRDDEDNLHYFVSMGAEGGNGSFHSSSHWSLWHEGLVNRRSNGSAAFTPISGGVGDWGNLYALTSFNDTKNNRRVQYGWSAEDIVGDDAYFSANQQGFQGAYSLPRELFVLTTRDVVNVDGNLGDMGSAKVYQQTDGTYVAQTLGHRPLPDVVAGIRNGSTQHSWPAATYNSTTMLATNGSSHMELSVTFKSHSGRVGFRVGASPDGEEYTTIYYEPSNHTVIVDRTHSSLIKEFNNETMTGYFYPYTVMQYPSNNATQELMNWNIFLDGSLLEIYINERFSLTTRIYPSMESSNGFGIYVADGAQVSVEKADSWFGLYNVWPERPMNSSSPLIWDSAEETGNYTWWTGN